MIALLDRMLVFAYKTNVFLMAFIAGMFLTPPDVISQTLLAVLVYLLFELGIIMSKVFVNKKLDDE